MNHAAAATQTPSCVIETRELCKVYNVDDEHVAVRAVDGVTLAIPRGQSLAIMGPSGSGKSTLMHILGCLDQPTSGVYELEGRDVAKLGDAELARMRNRHIGFVFQTFHLLARHSALENVELPLLYGGHKEARAQAAGALKRVRLGDRMGHHPNQLSGGQKQRVAIARALVTSPSLLLADEPTGALDTATGIEILTLLDELHAEGMTLVVVTHDPGVARRAQRVIMMRDGKIVADGPPAQVLASSGGVNHA